MRNEPSSSCLQTPPGDVWRYNSQASYCTSLTRHRYTSDSTFTYLHPVSQSVSLTLTSQTATHSLGNKKHDDENNDWCHEKKMICLCDLCKCSAFSPLNYIFISKHSVVCIHLRQLWIPSQPFTTKLNEKRHLKGNTKGPRLKQLSAALSVFYLEYNLLKIYGFFHRSHFSPLGTKWSDWPEKQREQYFFFTYKLLYNQAQKRTPCFELPSGFFWSLVPQQRRVSSAQCPANTLQLCL